MRRCPAGQILAGKSAADEGDGLGHAVEGDEGAEARALGLAEQACYAPREKEASESREHGGVMRQISIDELSELLPELEKCLELEGQFVLLSGGRAIARLTAIDGRPGERPTHSALRALMTPVTVASERLVREDRDAR